MKRISIKDIVSTSTSHNPNIFKKVTAKKGEIPHIVQIAQVTLQSGDTVPTHSHSDLYEVFYVEAGQGKVTINNVDQVLKTGEVLTIEPGELHSFKNDAQQDLVMFYFGVEIN